MRPGPRQRAALLKEFAETRDRWVPVEYGTLGTNAIQWDGGSGSDCSTHGHGKRVLEINFFSLAWIPITSVPSITVELTAERYTRPPLDVPVYLTIPGEPEPSPKPQPEWL
jgi:hypothetical protein